jgi:uncharacterized protein (TIGR00730 family)
MTNPAVVVVFGSSQALRNSAAYHEAQRAGMLLAGCGCIVCSGGYGGLMEAASRGAKLAGGSTIGVTTRFFQGQSGNRWLDTQIETDTFMERLQKIVEIGDAYLALKGGIGTLTEIATAWSLLQTNSLRRRPLVLLSDPWQDLLDFCRSGLIIRPADFKYIQLAPTPDSAVDLLRRALGLGE